MELPHLPTTIWIEHVLPFLDRTAWNHLCATHKELYKKSKCLIPPWPVRKNLIVQEEGSRVCSLASSKDGKWIAVGDADDATIQLVSCQTGKRIKLPESGQHHLGATGLCFSPDGHWLASGRWDDCVIRVWNIQNLCSPPTHSRLGVSSLGRPYQCYMVANVQPGRLLVAGIWIQGRYNSLVAKSIKLHTNIASSRATACAPLDIFPKGTCTSYSWNFGTFLECGYYTSTR